MTKMCLHNQIALFARNQTSGILHEKYANAKKIGSPIQGVLSKESKKNSSTLNACSSLAFKYFSCNMPLVWILTKRAIYSCKYLLIIVLSSTSLNPCKSILSNSSNLWFWNLPSNLTQILYGNSMGDFYEEGWENSRFPYLAKKWSNLLSRCTYHLKGGRLTLMIGQTSIFSSSIGSGTKDLEIF